MDKDKTEETLVPKADDVELSAENPEQRSTISIKIVETAKKDEDERNVWENPIEFLMSCISMSVGLGNIWRFPFVAFENGGGAFLIPYLIVLVFVGRPIYFLEMSIGQFCSYGSVKMWGLSPFFIGIGFMGFLAATCIVSFYCSITATTIYYLAVSFQKTLPWTVCDPKWKGECINCTVSDCSQLYFDKTVTEQINNIDNGLGAPLWKLTLCLLAAWIFIFLSLVKGTKSSGKVAYITAIFPYVVLIIFLIRGLTLEGASAGVYYFIRPDFSKIGQPEVWFAAISQCFFSLGTGPGTITMLASYNSFKNKTYRDALIITLMDTFTSLLGGFTIFSVLGHLAFIKNKSLKEVTVGGPGLAFVSYPSAISQFPGVPQLFSVLFFLMLLTLGIGTANALAGTMITVFQDQFPHFKKWAVVLVACIIGFLSGLIYITPGGQFMVTFMDFYGSGFVMYIICMLEVIAVAWVYGLHDLLRDIEYMLDMRFAKYGRVYWVVSWTLIIPLGLILILIYTFSTIGPLTHNGKDFPVIATVFGWMLSITAILMVPVCGAVVAFKAEGNNFWEKFKNSFKPSKSWGPHDPIIREGWEKFKTYTESDICIPVSSQHYIYIYSFGVQDRIELKTEQGCIMLKLDKIDEEAVTELMYFNNTVYDKCKKIIYSWLGRSHYIWKVREGGFQTFFVLAEAERNIIKGQEFGKNDEGDFVISIHY